jgi:pimeloyl-ACP methyl ester carboxylesterase
MIVSSTTISFGRMAVCRRLSEGIADAVGGGREALMDYVLVHGTTQSPVGWQRLGETLTSLGHRVCTVDLTEVDSAAGTSDLHAADYARAAASQIDDVLDAPVVVAHSASGLMLPAIADALQAGHLVWLAAVVPDLVGGRSFAAEVQAAGSRMFNPEWRSLTEPPTADPVVASYFLFHDCDLETLRWGLSTVRLFYPVGAYQESPQPTELSMPSTYVLPTGSRALRPEWMREIARDRLGIDPVEIDAGHCPHVSHPKALAELLTRRL